MKKLIVASLLAFFSLASLVSADGLVLKFSSNSSLGYYMVDAEPGQSLKFEFETKNMSSKAMVFDIYPSDVLTGINGGMDFRNASDVDKNDNIGKWITVDGSKITLKAGETHRHIASVKVPEDVKDGQYIGVVAVEYMQTDLSRQDKEGATVKANRQVKQGIQIVININKENALRDLEVLEPKTGYARNGKYVIDLLFNNKGDILEKPYGTLTLRNKDGIEIDRLEFQMDSVYENTIGVLRLMPSQNLFAGDYTLDSKIKYNSLELSNSFDFVVTEKEHEEASKAVKEEKSEVKEFTTSDFLHKYWILILVIAVTFLSLLFIIIFLLWKRSKEKKDSNGGDIIRYPN